MANWKQHLFKHRRLQKCNEDKFCRGSYAAQSIVLFLFFHHIIIMKTRLAIAKDAKDVAAIIKRHAQEDYMGYVTFNESYVKEKMKKNNLYFVAEVDEKIMGCLRASIVDIDLAEIRNICVEERFRNHGIATQLLDAAMTLLKDKNMRKIV